MCDSMHVPVAASSSVSHFPSTGWDNADAVAFVPADAVTFVHGTMIDDDALAVVS